MELAGTTADLTSQTLRKVTLRLIPFLILCSVVAFLDHGLLRPRAERELEDRGNLNSVRKRFDLDH